MEIPYELKKRCVDLYRSGASRRDVYEMFCKEHPHMSWQCFRSKLTHWKNKAMADDDTLRAGTYGGFIAHNATVQVDGDGKITQAWIKQTADDNTFSELCDVIREDIKPVPVATTFSESDGMLEIPLFDMHFPIGTFNYYQRTQAEIAHIIHDRHWDKIVFVVGQDLFHNNDMRGRTAKGTEIQKVDIPQAWRDARLFFMPLIDMAIRKANKVEMIYSKGNHDECMAWCFVQELKARYPQLDVDDTLRPRKAISWEKCFIGVGHCEYSNNLNAIFQDFVLDFPTQFAAATVREVHTGHLHRESMDNGLMVRRLASGVPTDEWSSENGFIGAHKRFQVFEWEPGRLRAIRYV